ncbi:hypothetical protein F4779DRAFT_246117 [Xylariaceae sp. FL0662B]|nr:hypothetical protein F4779DRAFT_246117 [Xylariaceae sp. FL0662B]
MAAARKFHSVSLFTLGNEIVLILPSFSSPTDLVTDRNANLVLYPNMLSSPSVRLNEGLVGGIGFDARVDLGPIPHASMATELGTHNISLPSPKASSTRATFVDLRSPSITSPGTHSATKSFTCTVQGCSRSFMTEPRLKAHVKRHDFRFSCPRCPERFGAKKDLERHQSTVHGKERPFTCNRTGCPRKVKGFSRHDNLKRHIRDVHDKKDGGDASTPPPLRKVSIISPRKRQREESEALDLSRNDDLMERINKLEAQMENNKKRYEDELKEQRDMSRELIQIIKDIHGRSKD